MPTLFRAALLALGPVAFSFAAACSDGTSVPGPDASKQECPTTIAAATAVDAKCIQQNYICAVGFPCNPVYQQATCTCDTVSGWSCLLSSGKHVDPGTTDTAPLCQPTSGPNPEACPATTTDAQGTTCKTSGKTCFYSGVKCAGDVVPRTDNCQCKGNTLGDAGLSWACEVSNCN